MKSIKTQCHKCGEAYYVPGDCEKCGPIFPRPMVKPSEVDEWISAMKKGFAITEFLPNLCNDYRELWEEKYGKEPGQQELFK